MIKGSSLTRIIFALVLLTITYALTLASFHPWDVLMGLLLSAGLLLASRAFLFGEEPPPLPAFPRRAIAFFPFAVMVLWDVMVGTWYVAQVALRLRPLVQPGIVVVPIEERTPNGVAVCSLVTTLSPGSFLVDVDWQRGIMLFHNIDAGDPDAVRKSHRHFYERYQRHVFP
jgi:multisubunit Na+/H+ antiporter MnhE subunit